MNIFLVILFVCKILIQRDGGGKGGGVTCSLLRKFKDIEKRHTPNCNMEYFHIMVVQM